MLELVMQLELWFCAQNLAPSCSFSLETVCWYSADTSASSFVSVLAVDGKCLV